MILYLEYWKKPGPKWHFWAGLGQKWLKIYIWDPISTTNLKYEITFWLLFCVTIVSTISYAFAARNWSYVSLIAEYIDIWWQKMAENRYFGTGFYQNRKIRKKNVILYLEYLKKPGPKCNFWAGFGQKWLKIYIWDPVSTKPEI